MTTPAIVPADRPLWPVVMTLGFDEASDPLRWNAVSFDAHVESHGSIEIEGKHYEGRSMHSNGQIDGSLSTKEAK